MRSVSSVLVEADAEDIGNEADENDESLGARLGGVFHAATSNSKVTFGLIIVGFFVLLALCSPLIVHTDANAFGSDISVGPSAAHPLGTTSYGQDVLDQLIVGSRVSVAIGFITGIVATIISVIVGLVSGYIGGWTDESLSVL